MDAEKFETYIEFVIEERKSLLEYLTDYEGMTEAQNLQVLTEVGFIIETEKKRLILKG
tara:strand:+ start:122 stop:295 length:174 start_codon:yes stop_codon:yes gene_type:complete